MLNNMLFANFEEIEHQKILEVSKEMIAILSEKLKYKNREDSFLLFPTDTEATILVINSYNEKYIDFKNERNNLKKNLSFKELSTFYLNIFKEKIDIKFTSMMQYHSRAAYEHYMLYHLKKDLIENKIDIKNSMRLLDEIKELLLLDTQATYRFMRDQNIFYAKNIKKYIDIQIKNSKDSLVFNKNTYPKFLFYLNRGEELIIQGIKSNDFQPFDEFINNDLHISDEEIEKIKKGLYDSDSLTDIWVKSKVYMKYLITEDDCSKIMRYNIETEKILLNIQKEISLKISEEE